MIATEEGDWFAAGMYHNLVYRLTKALDKIREASASTRLGAPAWGVRRRVASSTFAVP